MNLIRRHRQKDALTEEAPYFGEFLDGLFQRAWLAEPPARSASYPLINLAEDQETYRLTAELPGVDEKDIEIRFSGDTLLLKGAKSHEDEKRASSRGRFVRVPEGWFRRMRFGGVVARDVAPGNNTEGSRLA